MMPGSVLALILCLLMEGHSAAPDSKPADANAPIWMSDIVPDLGRVPIRNGALLIDKNRAGLAFLNDKQLIVYAVYHKLGELSSRSSPEETSPFRLNVWVVDSRSGEINAQKEWGTREHDSAVQATSGGILVKTGGLVQLYSPDFTQVRALPLTLDANARVLTTVSPSGKTIIVDRLPPKSLNSFHDHFDVLDPNSLTNRYSWDQSPPLYGRYSISDTGIATATSDGRTINFTPFGSPRWQVLLDGTCLGSRPTLVTDDLLVTHCKGLTVLAISLGVLYTIPMDVKGTDTVPTKICEPYDGRLSEKTSVSSASHMIALSWPILKIKKHPLTEATTCLAEIRVVGFDLAQRKQNLTLNVEPVPENDYDFALSPDGSMMAILNDRKVSVYRVPVQSNPVQPKQRRDQGVSTVEKHFQKE
jgi:hypothetical protein